MFLNNLNSFLFFTFLLSSQTVFANICGVYFQVAPQNVDKIIKVIKYYDDIDKGNLKSVFDLFHKNSSYKRGDSYQLNSKEDIVYFYKNQRSLSGKHTVEDISMIDDMVYVEGFF